MHSEARSPIINVLLILVMLFVSQGCSTPLRVGLGSTVPAAAEIAALSSPSYLQSGCFLV